MRSHYILATILVFFPCTVLAWPDKPVTVFVGWSAGGASDITSRAVVKEMESVLGEKIIVINSNGAHGSIAGSQVMKADADGYTWFGGPAVQGTWRVMGYTDISWSDFYSFFTVSFPTTIYVRNDAPWQSIEDLLSDIKANTKNKFRYGHPGIGSNGHIFGGLVLAQAGIEGKVTAIPYGGGREAGRYLLSGQIQFASVTMGDLADYATAGRIRPLSNLYNGDIEFQGVNYPSITRVYPQLEPYQAINPYFGIYLPRNTPHGIVEKVAQAFANAVQQPGFKKLAVEDRAGVLMPLLGHNADVMQSKITSARSWALQNLGIARQTPASFTIPKVQDWQWPPRGEGSELVPWPESVEQINSQLKK